MRHGFSAVVASPTRTFAVFSHHGHGAVFRPSSEACLRQAALASAIEQRLAADAVSEDLRRSGGKGANRSARHVRLELRATEKPLAERFAKYGRSVDRQQPEAEEDGAGSEARRSVVWSADERAAALATMERAPMPVTVQNQTS